MNGRRNDMAVSDSHALRILAKNLKDLREHHGYTAAQVAEHCNTTGATISRCENGLTWPFPDLIDRLASLYQIRIEKLFRPGGAAEKAFDSISATKIHALEIVTGMAQTGEVNVTLKDGTVQLSLARSKAG